MNYRHAFHAGNHTEVFKHSVLIAILQHLCLKPNSFAAIDTHAGVGRYDLRSVKAARTGEAAAGIVRLLGRDVVAARQYLDLVLLGSKGELLQYPGSPEIIRRMMRAQDRLIACELHPEDFQALKENFAGDHRVAVHHRDGYTAVRGFVPPIERRGLVFLDPPFELKDEAERLAQAIADGIQRWPTGIFVAWYPIKGGQTGNHIGNKLISELKLNKIPNCLSARFIPLARADGVLSGSGLIICNPPWNLDRTVRSLCAELMSFIGGVDGRWSVEWLSSKPAVD